MSGTPEPPDWLLPPGTRCPTTPTSRVAAPVPGGTFGLRVRTVSEVSRAIRERVRADDGLRDLWVEGEVGRVTVSTAGPRVLHAQGRPRPAPVRVVPRRPGALAVPAADRAPGRRPRADGPVRAAGRAAAVRRVAPAVGVRQPRDPVRAAQGRARRGGPVRRGPEAAAAPAAADDRRHHLADRRRLARRVHRARARWPMARVVLVACQVQGDAAPASHRGRVPAAGAVDRRARRRRPRGRGARRHDPRPRRRLARGPVVVQRRARRARGGRAPDAGRVRRGPRGRRHARRLRRRRARAHAVAPPRSWSSRTGSRSRRRSPRSAGAPRRRRSGGWASRAASSTRSAGRSTGSGRGAQLAASRERAGLLLDRAARVVAERLAAAAAWPGAAGGPAAPGPAGPARSRGAPAGRPRAAGAARRPAALATATTSLAATRRVARRARAPGDPRPRLRDRPAGGRRRHRARPGDAPAGTPLSLALADGRLAATSDGPHADDGQGVAVNADDLGWAFLFLVIVALFVTVGVVVGMIAARTDRPAHGAATPPAPTTSRPRRAGGRQEDHRDRRHRPRRRPGRGRRRGARLRRGLRRAPAGRRRPRGRRPAARGDDRPVRAGRRPPAALRALLAEAELRVQQLLARPGGVLAAVDVVPRTPRRPDWPEPGCGSARHDTCYHR